MKCKLIGMDFDGTLLNDHGKVNKENYTYLHKAQDAGITIVGITARVIKSSKDVVDFNYFDYLILNNGAYIYNCKTNTGKYISKIDKSLAKEITSRMDAASKQIDYCTANNYYIYKNQNENNNNPTFIIDVNSTEEVSESIAKMNIFLNDESKVEEYKKLISEKYPNVNCFIMQDSYATKKWLVVTPCNINKKNTLEQLGKELNISLEEMTFFGDGLNDLEVIASVGNGIAMGNALEEVKSKAKDITLSNNENGIAHYIKTKILKDN